MDGLVPLRRRPEDVHVTEVGSWSEIKLRIIRSARLLARGAKQERPALYHAFNGRAVGPLMVVVCNPIGALRGDYVSFVEA